MLVNFGLAFVMAFNDIQLSFTPEDFNHYFFLLIPHKTVANMPSTAPTCGFLEKFHNTRTVQFLLQFFHLLHIQKADVNSSWFFRASPYVARLIAVLINRCIESSFVSRQRKQANVYLEI